MPLFDFACVGEPSHVFEKNVKIGLSPNPVCPVCGELSNKLLSAPRIALEGFTGDFPDAATKWVRMRAEKQAQERKQNS